MAAEIEELADTMRRNIDMQVDTVEQRPGNLGLVILGTFRGAAAALPGSSR